MAGNSPSSAREPRWNASEELRQGLVPEELRHWLWDPGSLTAKLRQTCPGHFSVKLLRQRWRRPLPSEGSLLGMRRRGMAALVREVELLCDGMPWVFARTLIPASSLRGGARRLGMLGTKPLGQVLFTDPGAVRGPMQIARLTPRHTLFATATASLDNDPDDLWGRRTLFHFAGAPLLVNEFFLPSCWAVTSG